MAVTMGMFIFEVVVEKVNSLVASRHLVIKSEFADVFSLELKDPKQMYIVMPEPPPLPPDPPGKKKKPPKPKKPKKGAVVLPPPEPKIQSGQSVLFSSSAEFLIQNMKKWPLVISLWSKEDNLSYIGSNSIPWDPKFLEYLQKISDCQIPTPVTLAEEYNIFEEDKGKMMAKIAMQVKLTFMTEKITTSFRTLSEDPSIKKFLYTGMNSKTTSYMCTMKTIDEDFEANCNKIENSYIVDKPKANKVVYADYKNAPSANLGFFKEGDYCCMSHADKPPESIYKSPETCPDINFIIDYVRKIIVSCNDNMRMLTPRPTISPRIKATDIDRLCYCRETAWPKGELAERFKKEALSEPCPICIDPGKRGKGARGATFDIANIRGPCGKPECRIARAMRAYIENLVDEDNVEFEIDDIIGPCGSKVCTLATKIQEFLRHEGAFAEGAVLPALSTRCACLEKMQEQLMKREDCVSMCSKDCEHAETDDSTCEGMACPFNSKKVYDVYYFTVEHDFDKKSTSEPSEDDAPSSSYKYCASSCPSVRASQTATCSKTMCSSLSTKDDLIKNDSDSKCQEPVCPDKRPSKPSPADSNVEIDFDTIRNPCCVKSCNIAEKVKEFIADSVMGNKRRLKCMALEDSDPCYCDCVCSFKFSNKTTYCSVCGGYECLADDMRDLPDHQKPHPCPIYHKMYDRNRIKTKSPWPEETTAEPKDTASGKSSRAASKSFDRPGLSVKTPEKEVGPQEKNKKATEPKKKASKFTNNVITETTSPQVEKKPENKYRYPPVPKNMGWNWTAEDIPGMKPRPQWRPGAANKILVRRYRAIREGMDVIAKKKRALMQRKNKIGMKPALIVTKQNGEYIVQMEVLKKYSNERLIYQYPYDEKPPLIYTIGKTEEEKKKVQEKRNRKARRDTRRKSRLLQSTFRDKCQEICLKAYNQAIGILPLPNPNDPECPCFTKTAESLTVSPADSCSCSDGGSIESSDTDNDEWVIEFNPPASKWDAKAKHPPVLSDNETQYTYLDYKVKLLDKCGNPVPRYFKGSDGRQECSDLGGFWGPGHVWQEINKDGYIGPDQRWVPMNFVGPDGMFYSAEEGNFTDSSGQLLKIGIDGYIDKDLKWVWYGKRKPIRSPNTKSSSPTVNKRVTKSPAGDAPQVKPGSKAKPTSVASSDNKNKKDKKVALASGTSTAGKKNPLVMSVSVNYMRNKLPRVPSTYPHRNKIYVNNKLAKYRDIMGSLQMYEDLDTSEDKPQHNRNKTNRAMNTINVEKPRRLDVFSPTRE